jgi:hypothetical protein
MKDRLNYNLEVITSGIIDMIRKDNSCQFLLLNGHCGIYLLLFLHSKRNDKEISKIHNHFVAELSHTLKNPRNNFSDGISGVGWMLQLLADEEIMDYEDVSEVLNQIDDSSYEFAMGSFKENNHDFLYGAVGEMIYLLNRTKHNVNVKNYLTKITDKLIQCSKTCKEGVYWNESDFIGTQQKPEEVINLGISHGQASKIVIFSKLVEQGIHVEKYSEVLKEVIRFTLNCKHKYTEETFFPSVIENGIGSNSSFWWSYGDLGIAIALWQAGNTLKDDTIKKEAESVFLYYSDTKTEETGVYEASLCRGTSGIALMYHNMYVSTRNEDFKKASEYWYNETLKLAKHNDGIGGYKFLNHYAKNNEDFYQCDPNLLMGSAGVGLALLSYLSGKKQKWSECILLN